MKDSGRVRFGQRGRIQAMLSRLVFIPSLTSIIRSYPAFILIVWSFLRQLLSS